MFISESGKFVFVAVPKTATSTIHAYLEQAGTDPLPTAFRMEQYHYSYPWIVKNYPETKDYFSFGFASNPWDRMVSSWIEFTSNQGQIDTWSQGLVDDFQNFADFAMNFTKTKWAEEIHFHPASWYLGCDQEHINCGETQVDFIGRFENFGEDFNRVLAKINRSQFDILNWHKLRKSDRHKDYQKYYSNFDMVEMIGDHFHDDIVNFGYKF